ncbi:TRM11 family SAM-dependent methyltransferase [Kribbella sp. NPDC004536]|uniref:TRM11 family SAM-dependent methyltransferase n=1 Tax=Kribbella sp. NPDC004536 TaxID=3364106 RepID=UPI0036B1DA36
MPAPRFDPSVDREPSGASLLSLTDRLVLRTVDGAADLLTADLRAIPSVHSIRQTSADNVECTLDGPVDELAACPLYSTVELPNLALPRRTGLLSTVDGRADLLTSDLRAMPPVRSIRRISAETVECTLAGPVDELAACPLYSTVELPDPDLSRRTGLLGTVDAPIKLTARGAVQFVPLAWTRRFGRVERLPWSTNLIVAEVLVRLAKLRPGDRVLDPFCGTGTILRAAHRHEPGALVAGVDRDRVALELAACSARPARDLRTAPARHLVEGRAEELPFGDGCVDRVVANLPFGKQVGSHRENQRLYPAMLRELERVVARDGRAVLLTEDKRLLREAVQRSSFKVVRERLFRYNGATPTAYVLTRVSTRAKSR